MKRVVPQVFSDRAAKISRSSSLVSESSRDSISRNSIVRSSPDTDIHHLSAEDLRNSPYTVTSSSSLYTAASPSTSSSAVTYEKFPVADPMFPPFVEINGSVSILKVIDNFASQVCPLPQQIMDKCAVLSREIFSPNPDNYLIISIMMDLMHDPIFRQFSNYMGREKIEVATLLPSIKPYLDVIVERGNQVVAASRRNSSSHSDCCWQCCEIAYQEALRAANSQAAGYMSCAATSVDLPPFVNSSNVGVVGGTEKLLSPIDLDILDTLIGLPAGSGVTDLEPLDLSEILAQYLGATTTRYRL